jgi:hypothetical protein
MTSALSVRLGAETLQALAHLEATGLSRSEAIGRAILDSAARLGVLVAPTSRSAKPASFRPEIELLGETTRVLVEQVGAVDAGRLGELVGRVSPERQWGIDEAMMTVLGLR